MNEHTSFHKVFMVYNRVPPLYIEECVRCPKRNELRNFQNEFRRFRCTSESCARVLPSSRQGRFFSALNKLAPL